MGYWSRSKGTYVELGLEEFLRQAMGPQLAPQYRPITSQETMIASYKANKALGLYYTEGVETAAVRAWDLRMAGLRQEEAEDLRKMQVAKAQEIPMSLPKHFERLGVSKFALAGISTALSHIREGEEERGLQSEDSDQEDLFDEEE